MSLPITVALRSRTKGALHFTGVLVPYCGPICAHKATEMLVTPLWRKACKGSSGGERLADQGEDPRP